MVLMVGLLQSLGPNPTQETSQSLSNLHQNLVSFHCDLATLLAEECFSLAAAHLVRSLVERHPSPFPPATLKDK